MFSHGVLICSSNYQHLVLDGKLSTSSVRVRNLITAFLISRGTTFRLLSRKREHLRPSRWTPGVRHQLVTPRRPATLQSSLVPSGNFLVRFPLATRLMRSTFPCIASCSISRFVEIGSCFSSLVGVSRALTPLDQGWAGRKLPLYLWRSRTSAQLRTCFPLSIERVHMLRGPFSASSSADLLNVTTAFFHPRAGV